MRCPPPAGELCTHPLHAESLTKFAADAYQVTAFVQNLSPVLLCMQANLLQPLADPATLGMRLDAVGELLAEATLRSDLQVR